MDSSTTVPTSFNRPIHELKLIKAMEALSQFLELNVEDEELKEDIQSQIYDILLPEIDPPLEAIWIEVAMPSITTSMDGKSFKDRISTVRSQFADLSACAAACGFSKSIAVLAPVCVCISGGLLLHTFSSDFDSDSVDAMCWEIRALVDSMLGYVSVCCFRSSGDDRRFDRLLRPLEDLLAVWMPAEKRSVYPRRLKLRFWKKMGSCTLNWIEES